jgi:hypothetical protein
MRQRRARPKRRSLKAFLGQDHDPARQRGKGDPINCGVWMFSCNAGDALPVDRVPERGVACGANP